MFFHEQKKRVALAISVFLFVIVFFLYHTCNHLSNKPGLAGITPKGPVYKNGSRVGTFIYSEKAVKKTLRGIRKRNCYALNRFKDAKIRRSYCNSLQQCNLARSEVSGLPEGCQQRLPKCIIIGVPKSGTVELINFLSIHPSIIIRSYPKYLIPFYNKHWNEGNEWHREQMPFSFKHQITLYKANYYYNQKVPERMKMSDPDLKLILIVRNPVDRIISHYTFRNPESPLSDLIKYTKEDKLKHWYYDRPFEQYLRYFSRAQIHVIDSEKFQKDPQHVLSEVETFLGLPHVIKRTDFAFNRDTGFFCVREVSNNFSSCFGDDRGRKKIQDDTKFVKHLLYPFFKSHNERFSNLTGLRFNWL